MPRVAGGQGQYFATMSETTQSVKNGGRLLWVLAIVSILGLAIDLGWRIYRELHPSRVLIVPYVDYFARYKTVLSMFKVDCGRYPTTEEGLKALMVRPQAIPAANWHGPYFESAQSLKDHWNHDYVYRCPGIHNIDGFDLFSCGPDGVSITDGDDTDDINNWNSTSYMRKFLWSR